MAVWLSVELPLSYRAQGERAVADARVRQATAALAARQGFGIDDRATDRPRPPTIPTPMTRWRCYRPLPWKAELRSDRGQVIVTGGSRSSEGGITHCHGGAGRSTATISTRVSSLEPGTAKAWTASPGT